MLQAMTKTETADYKFTVKEFEPGPTGEPRTFLACEPMTQELSVIGNRAFLSLHLKPGIDVHKAHEIARFLQQHISCFGLTRF